MKNPSGVAQKIVDFYAKHKGVGHTKALVTGISAAKAGIIVSDEAAASRAIKGVDSKKLVSLDEIENGELEKVYVSGWPLVLDNGAVVTLLSALLARKEKPEKKEKK